MEDLSTKEKEVLIESHPSSSSSTTYFMQALDRIKRMHEVKAHDYTDTREFGNFEDSARHAGTTTAQAIEVLVGTKEARRQNLETAKLTPKNESLEDTLLDRAVYCIIRYAHYISGKDADANEFRERF